jgi:hypothetical protein
MPLVAGIGLALGASAGTAAAVGTLALGATAATGASLYNASKARDAAAQAAKDSQVNIDALNEQTKAIARQNAMDSANLEAQLTPEVPQLRTAANQGVLAGLTPDAGYLAQKAQLEGELGKGLNTPLLNEAIAKAQADLRLGGSLSPELQNLVTRGSLANAASVGGGGLGLGRDLVARDLGLTSLGLENSRLQTALGAGNQELGLAQANQGGQFSLIQLLQQMNQAQYSRQLAAAQFGQSIRPPDVGLNPGSIAGITIGNSNAAGAAQANQSNIYGQQSQNYGNLAGNLLGYGLLSYNNKPAINNPYGTTTGYNLGASTYGGGSTPGPSY